MKKIEPIRKYIAKNLSEGERYAQLAEECNELGKAAWYLDREIKRINSKAPDMVK